MGSHARRHEYDGRAERVERDHSEEPEVEATQADDRDVLSRDNLRETIVDMIPGVTVELGPHTPHLVYDDVYPDYSDDLEALPPIPTDDMETPGQGGIEYAA